MGKPMGVHHVAYACRDIDETNHFYTELMGMPLVHTEVKYVRLGLLPPRLLRHG